MSRDIDYLIAEKVFKWKLRLYGGVESWKVTDQYYLAKSNTPDYSTKVEDAWKVAKLLEREGIFFSIHKWVDGGYVAKVEYFDREKQTFDAMAEERDMPMALCKAALKAHGWEDNQ